MKTLEDLWKIGETNEFLIKVASFILLQLLNNERYDLVIRFLSEKSLSEVSNFSGILEKISENIKFFNGNSNKIIGILSKLPLNSVIFNHFLPDILRIFQYRKLEFNSDELVFVTETIKILMTVFIKSNDKGRILNGILPLFLSLYHKSYPVSVIKAVSKALQYIYSSCQELFKSYTSSLSEIERKYIENRLITNTSAVSNTSTQPTITLQLKFKKS
jgi:hypothetical protein